LVNVGTTSRSPAATRPALSSAGPFRLRAVGVEVLKPPTDEPWGLREMWVADPDGVRVALVQVPLDHPLRRG
jgi:hypothetical protein